MLLLVFNLFLLWISNINCMGIPNEQDLLNAANDGDIERVQDILDANQYTRQFISVNVQDRHGRTPLHYAAWHDHDDVVSLLLDYGADTSIIENDDECTALHWAIEICNLRSAIILINHPSTSLTLRDGRGLAPLHIACFKLDDLYDDNETEQLKLDCKKIIRTLIQRNVLVHTVMDWLEELGSPHGLDYLDKEYRVSIYKPKIKDAIFKNQYAFVAYYATKVTFEMFDEKQDNPLHWAVEADARDIVKLILTINPRLIILPNKYNETPVEHAIFYNRWQILEFIFCKIADLYHLPFPDNY